jgi:hypothetical protein
MTPDTAAMAQQGDALQSPSMIAEAQSRAIEDTRQMQPSVIPGIPTGTYERVATATPPPKGMGPAGAKLWAKDRDEQLTNFGDWPGKGDHKAPPPPIRPNSRSFNPFNGTFTGGKGPSAFEMMGIDMNKFKADFIRRGGR